MLSLQPEQCAERVPQPSSPHRCHSYITVPMLAAAGSAHARSQCQGQLGTSAEPQDMSMEQQERLLVEPWPRSCMALWASTKSLHTYTCEPGP